MGRASPNRKAPGNTNSIASPRHFSVASSPDAFARRTRGPVPHVIQLPLVSAVRIIAICVLQSPAGHPRPSAAGRSLYASCARCLARFEALSRRPREAPPRQSNVSFRPCMPIPIGPIYGRDPHAFARCCSVGAHYARLDAGCLEAAERRRERQFLVLMRTVP